MKVIVFFLLFVWLLVLLYVLIEKVLHSGLDDFFQFFTNWSWSLQIILYYLLTSSLILGEELLSFCFIYLLIPCSGITFVVFGIVLLLILNDPAFILEYIGEYSAGVVFFGNALFHYIPPVILLFFIIVNCDIIRTTIAREIKTFSIWIFIYQVYSPLIIISIYRITVNYKEVYSIDINDGYLILMALLILTIYSGSLYYVLFPIKKKKK